MLVERAEVGVYQQSDIEWKGVQTLLNMRGWNVQRNGGQIAVANETQRFSVVVATGKDSMPAEYEHVRKHGFERPSLVVIHTNPRREKLLIGNRGGFCHVAIEDIALMRPNTPWIWPILHRHLFVRSRPSPAALRLASSLAADTLRLNPLAPP